MKWMIFMNWLWQCPLWPGLQQFSTELEECPIKRVKSRGNSMFPTMSPQHIKADKGFHDSSRIVMAREDFFTRSNQSSSITKLNGPPSGGTGRGPNALLGFIQPRSFLPRSYLTLWCDQVSAIHTLCPSHNGQAAEGLREQRPKAWNFKTRLSWISVTQNLMTASMFAGNVSHRMSEEQLKKTNKQNKTDLINKEVDRREGEVAPTTVS